MSKDIAKQFGPKWKKLIEVGRKIEKADDNMANTMTKEQFLNFKETVEVTHPMGLPDPLGWNAQLNFDLMGGPHYRLYDAIGMGMGGRYGESNEVKEWITEVTDAYIGCVEDIGVKNRKDLYDCVSDVILTGEFNGKKYKRNE